MISINKITSVLVACGLIGISTGCSFSGSAEASGSNHGHVKYKVSASVGIQFLAGSLSTPDYSIDVQGYPYNRIVLTASTITTNADGSTTTVPMQLVQGSPLLVNVVMNGYNHTYTTTIETSSDLAFGSYVINAPGIVTDVNAVLQQYPGSTMQLTVPSSYVPQLVPANSPYKSVAMDQAGSGDLVINFTSADMVPWASLVTTSPILGGHPGPVTKTM